MFLTLTRYWCWVSVFILYCTAHTTCRKTSRPKKPSAFAAELMNEPVSLNRMESFETWRAAAEAIHKIISDMYQCKLSRNGCITRSS